MKGILEGPNVEKRAKYEQNKTKNGDANGLELFKNVGKLEGKTKCWC